MTAPREIACYQIKEDGSDGCHVGFVSKAYAASENSAKYDVALVRIVEAYTEENDERSARRLYHCNRSYAIAEVVELMVDNN